MSHIVPQPKTTQAAEGLPRRPLTTHDLQRMVEIGIIGQDERVELIGVTIAQETGLYLSDDIPEPDFIFGKRGVRWADLKARDLLLVAEIADLSLRYDQGRKAELCASFGVRELWVIDAMKLTVIVQRDPQQNVYRDIQEFDRAEAATPLELPSLSVTLGALELL